jgi:type II pantothenate kinase
MIIGIDIGSTTTKAVAVDRGQIAAKIMTEAMDAVTSVTGAFGKLIIENDIRIGDVGRIIITGVGASKIRQDIFGIPTGRIDEMTAIGIGGMFQSGQEHIIICNVGTGTVIIEAEGDRISHLGGTGVGGGTILGLSKRLLGTTDFKGIMAQAVRGDIKTVDLLMEDIMDTTLSFLSREVTASNFGKMLDTAKNEDIALGLLNMEYQVIGMLAVFAARSKNLNRIVITGSGSDNDIGKKVLAAITGLYGIAFDYPPDGEYTTAIGAGLSAPTPIGGFCGR